MKKVLVVEDSNDINTMLCEMLSREDIKTNSAYSGTESLFYINKEKYDCIILDLMLPGKSGKEILGEIRKVCKTPVIIISAKHDIEGRVHLLESGADDYITKPFDLREVMARVKLQLQKSGFTETQVVSYHDLTLNCGDRTLFYKDQEISLTRQEYNILEILIKNPKKLLQNRNCLRAPGTNTILERINN